MTSAHKGSDNTTLALEAAEKDKYYPKYYGLYNVYLKPWTGENSNNIAQQWYYDPSDSTVHSMLHPESVFLEGDNLNLVAYKNSDFAK